jgi:hypothetical protein
MVQNGTPIARSRGKPILIGLGEAIEFSSLCYTIGSFRLQKERFFLDPLYLDCRLAFFDPLAALLNGAIAIGASLLIGVILQWSWGAGHRSK